MSHGPIARDTRSALQLLRTVAYDVVHVIMTKI